MERLLKHVQELGYFGNKTHTFKSIKVVNLLWHVHPMMPLTEKVIFTTVVFFAKCRKFSKLEKEEIIFEKVFLEKTLSSISKASLTKWRVEVMPVATGCLV